MPIHHPTLGDLLAAARQPAGIVAWSTGPSDVAVVDLDAEAVEGSVPNLPASVPSVVVGLTVDRAPEAHPAAPLCDLVLAPDDPAVEAALATAAAHPLAATALATLLRGVAGRNGDAGLAAESAVYSTLQGGPEFAAWRASRPRRAPASEGDAVAVERDGAVLQITLTRPHVRNALNTLMRDQLVEAFLLAGLDDTITEVHLRGEGESFCAGGDLDEFGSFPDPATAHLIRLQQSVGRAVAAVAPRVTAHLHGACVGSGIELPAFAGTVVAEPATLISLPEVSLGLIPGAGGTVSLPARIGRHRTARLALTGEVIDAPTALAWGLIDAIAPQG
jgi:enoyl-CoA hydratase/carnithine racemase